MNDCTCAVFNKQGITHHISFDPNCPEHMPCRPGRHNITCQDYVPPSEMVVPQEERRDE